MRTKSMADTGQKLATAISDAQSIIEAAERRAQELRGKTETAYREAYEKGFEVGKQEGRTAALESAIRLLEDGGAIGDRLATEAARLALVIAGHVVGEHIKVSPKSVRSMALKALQESVIGDSATIIVHPDDRPSLEDFLAELRRTAAGAKLNVDVDGTLSRGSCIIRTEFGEIDATLEALLDGVAQRLGLSARGAR